MRASVRPSPSTDRRTATARHVILPGQVVAQAHPRRRETVQRFLDRSGWHFVLPTICEIDGTPLLRAHRGWRRRRIRAGEHVEFVSRPMGSRGGGAGKSVLGLVAMIALSALAPGLGTVLAGTLGTLGGQLAAGVIMAGAGFALNTFLAPKVANKSEDTTKTLYDFGPQSNSARLGESLPVQYGRVKKKPDFIALPWTQYVGDDAYIHVLLNDGQGRYQREQIDLGTATLWTAANGVSADFSDVEIAFYEPNEPITLFPTDIAASAEVTGQELADDAEWIGPFATNAANTKTRRLAFDYSLPGGLYGRDAKNNNIPYLCRIIIEIRPINDQGAPTGPWQQLIQHDRWGASKQPMRFTLEADAPAEGRYQARCRRGVAEDFPGEHVDACFWAGMRAYLVDAPPSYPVSSTAIKMKASGQVSGNTATQFSTITTRILRVWTGSGWDEQPTRLPAWAGLDIATDDVYACDLDLAEVDVQAYVDLAALNVAKGETFDYEFRAVVQATEALDTPLRACRSRSRWLGSTLSLVREGWRAVPAQLITDREIVRDSLSIRYQLQPTDSADAIIGRYLDETTWTPAEVQVPKDLVARRPIYMDWQGVVQRQQAYDLTDFMYRQHTLRRVLPTFSTERDGRMLAFGDHISLQTGLPREWSAVAAITWRQGNVLAFDRDVVWGAGQHYIRIRKADGKQFGPIKVSRGTSDAYGLMDAADLAQVEAQQATTLTQALTRPTGSEPPSCAIGIGTQSEVRALVLRGRPSGNRVQLEVVVDSEAVHDVGGDPGVIPPLATMRDPDIPQVRGLIASLQQNVVEPVLSANWIAAPGAYYYLAWVSYDGGTTWLPLGEFRTNSLSVVVQPAALRLAVQAVGKEAGARALVELAAPTITADKLTVTAKSFEEGLKTLVTQQLGLATDDIARGLDTANTTLSELFASVQLLQMETAATVRRLPGAVQADVSERITIATGPSSLLAQQISTVTTTTNTLGALVETNQQAQINGDQALANSLNTVAAQGTVNAAAITAEQSARQNADSAQTSTLNNHESRLGAAEGTLGSHGQSIASVASQTQTLVNTTSAQAGTLTNHESRLGSAEGTIGAHGQSISSVASQTQTLVNTTSSLTNTVNTQTSRLNAAEGTLGSHGQSLAAYGSQITTLSQQQQQTAGYAASIEAALNSTNAYINSTVTFKWLATATPAGATSAVELAAVANNHTSGLVIINDPTGSKIGLRAGRVVAMAEDGTTKGLLDNSTGNLYIAGGMYAPSFVQTYHLGAYIITAEKLQLGAVVTDSIALAAVTNIVTQRRTATTTAANDVLWPSITRTPGTNLSIRLMLYFGAYTGATYGLPSEPSRWLVVRRWNGSVYADVASIVVRVMPKYIWFYNNVFSWSYGEHSAMFEFIDTDSVSGNVSYEILLLDSGGQYTGYPGGVGQRTIVLAESKR